MKYLRSLKSQKAVLALFIIVVFIILVRLSLPGMGRLLLAEDQPQQSDMIVLLMGSGPDRMLGAVDLYKDGYADRILMVRNNIRGYELVLERGVKIPHDTDLARSVAMQLGVPQEKVAILPGDASSTQDEARHIRKYLQDNKDIDSLILVTSKYHSGRAKKIFVRAMSSLDRPITVLSCPSSYDNFNAEYWWQTREDLKTGIQEYIKLTTFYFYEQFEL